jgi:hypothetical protein
MWGVAKCTIKVLFCYLKQSTATRPAARAGLLRRMPLRAQQAGVRVPMASGPSPHGQAPPATMAGLFVNPAQTWERQRRHLQHEGMLGCTNGCEGVLCFTLTYHLGSMGLG